MLKDRVLIEILIMPHVITQSVFQPYKDVNKTACKQP